MTESRDELIISFVEHCERVAAQAAIFYAVGFDDEGAVRTTSRTCLSEVIGEFIAKVKLLEDAGLVDGDEISNAADIALTKVEPSPSPVAPQTPDQPLTVGEALRHLKKDLFGR